MVLVDERGGDAGGGRWHSRHRARVRRRPGRERGWRAC
jgi:hypothetical protein